jgi:ABC-type transport system involved in multi-copper enzyme maturation permease subunit
MPDPAGNGPARPARRFGPATLRQWGEWAGLAAVAAAGAALAWWNESLTGWQRVAGWSLVGLVLAYLLRGGWVRLFGPVLFYDLVRGARRSRTYLTRCGYLALLLFFLWSVVGSQMERTVYRPQGNGYGPDPMAVREMAALAEAFFGTFMGVQFGLAVFLTPAYVAGAVAEEKERKTLEFLLATDLDSREIVLGKLAGRLGRLTLLLLTGLPVLSAVQFLGGVDPDLVLGGFAATALTVAGLAGLAILASVYARRARDAIMMAYLLVILYLALCWIGEGLVSGGVFPAGPLFPGGPTAADCLRIFAAGDPFHALSHVFSGTAGQVRQALPGVLRGYAAFYLLLTGATVTLAVLRLRPIALREAGGAARGAKRRWWRARRPVTDRPMLWKEMYHAAAPRTRVGVLLIAGLFVILSFVPPVFIVVDYVHDYFQSNTRPFYTPQLSQEFNVYVRSVGTVVACLGLLGSAVRGAAAVRVERDKDTLDALLTSPLSTHEILLAKWAGCLWGLRWPAAWLGSIYALGLVTGGLSPLALPLLSVAVFVYCGTLAAVGLWFSVVCRTTARAAVAAVFAALGMGAGHWALWLCCLPLGGHGPPDALMEFQAGLTPPFVLAAALPFGIEDHFSRGGPDGQEMILYAVVGTVCWAVVGAIVWAAVNDRFRTLTNREDVLLPEGRPLSVARAAGLPPAEK